MTAKQLAFVTAQVLRIRQQVRMDLLSEIEIANDREQPRLADRLKAQLEAAELDWRTTDAAGK